MRKGMVLTPCFRFLLGLLFISACTTAAAQSLELSAVKTPACTATFEANPDWSSLSVRLPVGCKLSQGELGTLLTAGMTAARNQDGVSYTSVFLGRLVDYPWMVKKLVAIAADSAEWDAKRGRAVMGHENPLIGRMLYRQGVLAREITILEKAGYTVTGVSVEKVLVGTAKNAPDYTSAAQHGKLPFDAQVWLVIKDASREH